MKTNKIVSTKTTLVTYKKDAEGKDTKEVASRTQGEAIKTDLTIDWDGCSEEDIRNMAQAALIVKLQGGWRANGTPSKIEVKAADHKVGARVAAPKLTVEEQVATLDKDAKQKLLEKLLAEMG